MFVLDILFHLQILQPERKGTMAKDRAVADGLNGYESFRPSAHEYSIVSFGLGLKLCIRGFVENALLRCIFDRGIRHISSSASQRKQNKNSDRVLIAAGTAGLPRALSKIGRISTAETTMDHELGTEAVAKIERCQNKVMKRQIQYLRLS